MVWGGGGGGEGGRRDFALAWQRAAASSTTSAVVRPSARECQAAAAAADGGGRRAVRARGSEGMGAGGGNDAPAVVASVAAPAAHPVGAATQSSAAALAPSLPAAHEQRVTLYVDAEARSVRGLAELRVRADDTQVMLSAPGVRTLTAYCPEFGENTSAADGQTGGAKELLMRPAAVRWLRGKGAGMAIKPPAPDPSTTPAQLADLGFERYTEKLRAGLVPTADVVLSLPACASSSSCDSLLAVAFEVDVGAGGVVFDGPWARLGSKRAPMSLFVPTVASRGQLPPPTELLLRIAVPRGHSAVTGGRLVCSEPGSVLDGAGDAYTYRLPLSNGKGAFDSFMVACGPFLRVPDRELKGVSYLCPARKLDACRYVRACACGAGCAVESACAPTRTCVGVCAPRRFRATVHRAAYSRRPTRPDPGVHRRCSSQGRDCNVPVHVAIL